jgi:hemerythrin-like domain-containing protein
MARIRAEHRALTAVLWSLQHLVQHSVPGSAPDFEVFSIMIDYIDLFPERYHHPKEDRYLFEAIAGRAPEARSILDQLTSEHVQGDRLIRDLRHALALYRIAGEAGRAEFAAAVDAYVDFHWQHMSREEDVVFPLATRVLTETDWQAIDAAFCDNADPLFGAKPHEAFRRLFHLIMELAPWPVGLGPARRREPNLQ